MIRRLTAALFAAATLSPAAAFAQAPPAPPAVTAPANAPLPPPPPWEALQSPYVYDAKTPPTVAAEPKEEGDTLRVHLTFTDAQGQKVTGLFVRPKKEGVYPVALLLHGRGGNKDQMVALFSKPMLEAGVACLALDAQFHGERKQEGKDPMDGPTFVAIVRTTVLDYRRALDYLATRRDVDPKKVGLFGYSMGAITGAIVAGVDARVNAAALCVGGDPLRPVLTGIPEPLRSFGESAAPSNYIGHVAPRPVYLVNGTRDVTITPDAAKRLIDAAKEPKTVVWVESGHILPAEPVQKSLAWLRANLDPKPAAKSAAK